MKATILVFQGCSPTLAYSYCCISATSGANKGNHHGTGSLVAEGHNRCFDWFSARLEGVSHGEYKVACKQDSLSGQKCSNNATLCPLLRFLRQYITLHFLKNTVQLVCSGPFCLFR